jgi:Na+-transporting NADH:ubiquinone oxidoreductase subunit NqrB
MENVTQLIVDLEEVQTVRGVQLQGGVPDPRFYGPACFSENWYWPLGFYGFGLIFIFSSTKDPVYDSKGFYIGLGYIALIFVMRIIAFINDPAVPGIWSGNPVCPMLVRPLGEGMERKTFKDKTGKM